MLIFRLITMGLSGAETCTHPARTALKPKAKTDIRLLASLHLILARIALRERSVNCLILLTIIAFPRLNGWFIIILHLSEFSRPPWLALPAPAIKLASFVQLATPARNRI